ncbi:MAG TPA: hypothetical protein VNE62_12235 [Actinomycetota bacterium]|nr:hypothetical protein [Actinomycetota bacterium]
MTPPLRRGRIACVLALLAALLPAEGPPAAAAPAAIAPVPEGITALLRDRGRAFEAKDRGLLQATLDPGSYAAAQLKAFDNASQVAFSTFRVEPVTEFSGQIAGERVKAKYSGREVAAFAVRQRSAVRGIETEPYVDNGYYTFVKSGGGDYDGWRLASDSDFDVLGGFSPRQVWDFGPVELATSEHFAVLVHPDQSAKAAPALAAAEKAYASVKSFWPRPATQRYLIVAPSTTGELDRILQSTIDLSKFVAFAARSIKTTEGLEPGGVRLFVQSSHFERYNDEGKQGILAHELIHAVTTPAAGSFMPIWVEEGLATHGSSPKGSSLPTARRGGKPGTFPQDEQFSVGSVSDIGRAYAQSQVAFEVLSDRYSAEGVAKFYEALGRTRIAAGSQEHHVAKALRESVGWTVDEWTKAWQDRL